MQQQNETRQHVKRETEHFLKCEFACHIKTSHQYPVQTAGSLIFCILITGRLFLSGNRKLQFLNKKTSDFGQVELWNLFQRDVTVGKLWTKYFSLGPRVKSNERFNITVDTSQEKVMWAWWMQPPLLAQIIKPSPLWRGRELKHHGKENKKLIWSSVQRCRLINSDCMGSESVSCVSSGQIRTGQVNDQLLFSQHNSGSQFYGHSQKSQTITGTQEVQCGEEGVLWRSKRWQWWIRTKTGTKFTRLGGDKKK